jgi:hypothetical protein
MPKELPQNSEERNVYVWYFVEHLEHHGLSVTVYFTNTPSTVSG